MRPEHHTIGTKSFELYQSIGFHMLKTNHGWRRMKKRKLRNFPFRMDILISQGLAVVTVPARLRFGSVTDYLDGPARPTDHS